MPPVTLTQLPRETRDSIYEYVFTWKEVRPACIGEHRRYTSGSKDAPTQIPPLFLVNRQISAEATVVFYSNLVWVGQPPELLCSLKKVGNRRNLIKVVEVERYSNDSCTPWMPQLFDLLSCLTGLRSVKLHRGEDNLIAARTQLVGMGLNLLKGQVEVIIFNKCFHFSGFGDGGWWTVHEIVWRRAAGAMNWVKEKEGARRLDGRD